MFGGQMLGVALSAAGQTAPAWPAHGISGFFLRGGRIGVPIELTVENVHDSQRFAERRVLARQDGRPFFDLLASFHDTEPGVDYQAPADYVVPDPDALLALPELARAFAHLIPERSLGYYTQPFPVELRLVDPELAFSGATPERDFWLRIPGAHAVEDDAVHRCLLALASDYWLPSATAAVLSAHGEGTTVRLVSLNHSFWMHRPARADHWHLYRTRMLWSGAGRGLARGELYDTDRRLVASATQEFLMRLMPPGAR